MTYHKTETSGKWCQERLCRGGRNAKERVGAVWFVCVAGWLTSELRLCTLWRAGHPVELFSPRLQECKAAASPVSLISAKSFGDRSGGGTDSGRTDSPSKYHTGIINSFIRRKHSGEVRESFSLSYSEVQQGLKSNLWIGLRMMET